MADKENQAPSVSEALPEPPDESKLIGEITHYFNKIEVAIIKLSKPLNVGDAIRIVGGNIDFTQAVDSMEIEHKKVESAKAGDVIGMKVKEKAREGYKVYKE